MLRYRWMLVAVVDSLLAGSEVGASPYGLHRVPLTTLYQPQHGPIGLVVKARANDGPPLRLLLDSGADHLTLDSKAARRSGLVAREDLDIVGAGATTRPARFATAERVQVGDLILHDCSVVIVEGEIAEGIDGVIPLSLFNAFSIQLDIPRRVLDLYPYSSHHDDGGFIKVFARGNLLFVRTDRKSVV